VHPAVVRLVTRLIAGDGTFVLAGQEARVQGGEARLTRTESLAGSTLTMSEALRRAVTDSGLSVEEASAAASANPARVLGLDASIGLIAADRRADLVVLDDDLQVTAVMAGGGWCHEM
jgi:N-acetylglucosamine-6-phosphate deacetylase